MNDRNPPHDPIDELGRELLRSARLDVQPVPDRVCRRIMVATGAIAGTMGAGSAATGAAGVAGAATGAAGAATAVAGAATGAAGAAASAAGAGVISGSTAVGGAAMGTGLVGAMVAKWVVIGAAAAVVAVGGVQSRRLHSRSVQGPAEATPKVERPPANVQAAGPRASAREVPLLGTPIARLADVPEPDSSRPGGANAESEPADGHPNPSAGTGAAAHRARRPAERAADPGRPTPIPASDNSGEQSAPSLQPEIASLDIARARMAAGDAPGALQALEHYDQRHPAGVLRAEATYLWIQAALRSGNTLLARKLAARFLIEHPDSPQAPLVRSLVFPPSSSAP